MKTSSLEELFSLFDQTATLLENELSVSYLEALAETGQNLFHQTILQENLSEFTIKKLKDIYQSYELHRYTGENIRKSFQLAILKGMRQSTQPNHQMTPDTIGILFGYLVDKFSKKTSLTILDPAVGTGNLLTSVMNQQKNKECTGIGIDIDDLLLKLAYVNGNLQRLPVELYKQDSLGPLFLDLVDAVVCDLPVGYYPDDMRAAEYELKSDTGHSYAHHLFIEQSIKYTKEAGFLFFLIPNNMFESQQASKLYDFLNRTVFIHGILQLPFSMFKNRSAAKSILILQKKSNRIRAPKKVLLADLPNLSKKEEVEKILMKIDIWISENIRD